MINSAKPLLTAHSGCMNTEENSIASIRAGIDCGADIVEVDVRFLDGVPVLLHNEWVSSERRPVKLEEAFQFISGKVMVNMDLKEYEPADVAEIGRLVGKYNLNGRVFFSGIEMENAERIHRCCPEIPYLLNYMPKFCLPLNMPSEKKLVSLTKSSGAFGINLEYHFVTKKIVEVFHAEDFLVAAWTVDEIKFMKKMLDYNIDSITTKRPDQLKLLMKEYAARLK
mgnify:CR=1 FL=1